MNFMSIAALLRQDLTSLIFLDRANERKLIWRYSWLAREPYRVIGFCPKSRLLAIETGSNHFRVDCILLGYYRIVMDSSNLIEGPMYVGARATSALW